jgi:hypothetical protein
MIELSPMDFNRFHAKFLRYSDESICWPWQGKPRPDGYGEFTYNYIDGKHRTIKLAHIVAYALHYKTEINQFVLHKCDNPICVNPHHLFLGDQAANMQDKQFKGREKRSSFSAKLVSQIEDEIKAGKTHRQIAHEYMISQATVSFIRNGKVRCKK